MFGIIGRLLRLKRLQFRVNELGRSYDWLSRLLFTFDDAHDIGVMEGVKYCYDLMQGKPVDLPLKTKRIYRAIATGLDPKVIPISREVNRDMGFRLAYDPEENEPTDKMLRKMKIERT